MPQCKIFHQFLCKFLLNFAPAPKIDEYEEIYDSENEDELNINVDDLDDDYLDESTNNG